jgi:hypothetical protein
MKQAPNLSTDLFDDAPTQQRPKLSEASEGMDFMDDLNEEEPARAKVPPPPPRAK